MSLSWFRMGSGSGKVVGLGKMKFELVAGMEKELREAKGKLFSTKVTFREIKILPFGSRHF